VVLLKLDESGSAPTQTVYEADASANTLSSGAVVQTCPGSWGYSCLDGSYVGWIGNGATVAINNVMAATAGTYQMTIYAMVSGTRSFDVSVNGGATTEVSVTGTSFSIPSTSGIQVQLNAGSNTILFSNPTAWAPDLDHIVISEPGAAMSGFNIAYPIQTVTIASPGQTGTASVTLIPTNGFSGNVTVNCTLPAAMTGATCMPATVALSGTGSGVATLFITTAAASTAEMRQGIPMGSGLAAKTTEAQPSKVINHRPMTITAAILPISGVLLAGFFLLDKSARGKFVLVAISVTIASMSLLQVTACEKGSAANSGGNTCAAVPGVPSGLTGSATTSTGTTLSWTASSVGANCAVNGYSIYQDGKLIATTTSTSYAVTGLAASTSYSFTVVAQDAYGASAASSALSMTTAAASSGTATPAGTYEVTVTATSGSITQESSLQVVVQ
jgi:hypothetical protein